MNQGMRFVLASVLAWGAMSVAAAATLEKVAFDGDPAPDPGFSYHRRFFNPAVSDAPGQRVVASVRLVPAAGRQCIVKFDPGAGPDGIGACRKDPSPEGHEYLRFDQPSINMTSDAVWAASVSFGLSGIYRGTSVVAFTGDPSPAGPGFLQRLSSGVITDAGDVVFKSTISGGAIVAGVPIDTGIFRCTGGDGICRTGGTGTLQTVVLKNDPVPDRPGRKLCDLEAFGVSTFGIVFRSATALDCASTTETPLVGMFRKPFAGAVTTLALHDEPSQPNTAPGGTVYDFFSNMPSIANTGIAAFQGRTKGLFAHYILYFCDPATCPASPPTVAVEQGSNDGAGNFFTRFTSPGVSDVGDIAFQSRFVGQHRGQGVYIHRVGGAIDNVARNNDIAPGVPGGGQFVRFGPAAMSSGGKVAFEARAKLLSAAGRKEGLFLFE